MFGNCFKSLFVIRIWLLFTVVTVGAQEDTYRYKGSFAIKGFSGEAEYVYTLVEGDTVLNGPFLFRSADLNALMETSDRSFLFSGGFKNGIAEGVWNFQFGEFKTDNTTRMVDFEYRLNVSGIQNVSSGMISNGRPDGKWSYRVLKIENSVAKDTLFASDFEFGKGIPLRNFEITTEDGTLIGRFLRNGLAHDAWAVYSLEDPTASEEWYFSEGRLESIAYGRSNQVQSIDVFKKKFDSAKSVNLDSRYLTLVELMQRQHASGKESSQTMPRLLKENIEHYQKIDTILTAMGNKVSFMPRFKVKVPIAAIDSVDAAQLDSIDTMVSKSGDITKELLKNTQLNILKRSDTEANYLDKVLQVLDSAYLKPLSKLKMYYDIGVVGYLNYDEMLEDLWPQGKPGKEIKVVIDTAVSTEVERTYKVPGSDGIDFSGNTLASLGQMAQYLFLGLTDISSQLNDKLDRTERKQELVALEEQLVAKADSLTNHIDSTLTRLQSREKKVFIALKGNIENQLNEYSGITNDTAKLDRANILVKCFGQIKKLIGSVESLPERIGEVQEKYKDRVWNPFTATLMDDVVKKRIVNAYGNILIPHLLDRITNETDCQNAAELRMLLRSLHERVEELRDEDTKKLERKLKRQRDPEVILQLFNLSLTGS